MVFCTYLYVDKQAQMAKINKDFGDKVIDKVTVSQLLGGMRSIKCMLWDVSLLDVNEGIRFRGLSIPELQAALPGVERGLKKNGEKKDKGEPLPEATLWYLMTGEVPTQAQVQALTADLHARSELPPHVVQMIDNFPRNMHPMSQVRPSVYYPFLSTSLIMNQIRFHRYYIYKYSHQNQNKSQPLPFPSLFPIIYYYSYYSLLVQLLPAKPSLSLLSPIKQLTRSTIGSPCLRMLLMLLPSYLALQLTSITTLMVKVSRLPLSLIHPLMFLLLLTA